MNETQMILGALALDLMRVAQSSFRGSDAVAERFGEEALARKKELQTKSLPAYLQKLLTSMEHMLVQHDRKKLADDALMYSTLFQNAALVEYV